MTAGLNLNDGEFLENSLSNNFLPELNTPAFWNEGSVGEFTESVDSVHNRVLDSSDENCEYDPDDGTKVCSNENEDDKNKELWIYIGCGVVGVVMLGYFAFRLCTEQNGRIVPS
jgi:hypothetical protein